MSKINLSIHNYPLTVCHLKIKINALHSKDIFPLYNKKDTATNEGQLVGIPGSCATTPFRLQRANFVIYL